MKRTLLSLILTLLLTLALLAPGFSAVSGADRNAAWYLDDEGTLTVSGDEPMTSIETDFEAPWSGQAHQIRAVVIADGVRRIDAFAFASCPALTSVTIPNSVTSIGLGAFSDCASLTEICIPGSVEEIGAAAFSGCGALTAIHVAEDNPCYADQDGVLTDRSGELLIQVPGGICGTYIVPETVTEISSGAFGGCHALTGVSFPDHMERLPEEVLRDLQELTMVKLPAALSRIPRSAFSGCTALSWVAMADGLEFIGDGAFENCAALGCLVLPESLVGIGDDVFAGCGALTLFCPVDSPIPGQLEPHIVWKTCAPEALACRSVLLPTGQGVALLFQSSQ